MAGGGRELPETPTWAVAVVCAVIVLLSVAMEHGLHILAHWFRRRQKKAMGDALEKIKAELMLLGFISLLLTVAQTPISKICIPKSAANILLPCKAGQDAIGQEAIARRSLAGAAGGDYCSRYDDKVALMSASGMHQLHIFIFVLAVFHVTYCVINMGLGRLKMKKWKKWESETNSLEYQFANDPSRFRFTHQTSFVKRHLGSYSSTPVLRWVMGSNMKKTILEEQTMKALMNWRKMARERKKLREADALLSQMSSAASPVHLLQDHRARSDGPPSPYALASSPEEDEEEEEPRDMYPVPASRRIIEPGVASSSSATRADIAESDFSFSAER
uniref:MLO-like protein n=1 Tax=Leersia perrieri TaxID=77586 RepID=A0A0D9WQ35_9ORYZ